MKNLTKLSAIALAGSVMMTSAKAVEIEVGYAYSSLFDVTMERLIPEFNKAHPDITVKFRATYENYEDGTNTILREAVAGDLPDVTFQGLNRQAILVEKGIAKSFEPFIAKEADFAKDGYHQAMLDLGTFNGEVYGLPYSVSLPAESSPNILILETTSFAAGLAELWKSLRVGPVAAAEMLVAVISPLPSIRNLSPYAA